MTTLHVIFYERLESHLHNIMIVVQQYAMHITNKIIKYLTQSIKNGKHIQYFLSNGREV